MRIYNKQLFTIIVRGIPHEGEYRRKMNTRNDIGKESTRFDEENRKALIELICQNDMLIEFIEKNYSPDTGRVKLLGEILQNIKCKQKEELLNQIYSYGSMLKEQDLIARQLFLWLTALGDELVRKAEHKIERMELGSKE